ncbi:MAG: LytTR family DNA-binding domain-containing protein [Steroidobacteraceae bacterium]
MNIRALIVDDEPYARERLRELCRNESDVEVVGEAAQGGEAIEKIEELRPDLLLLDVQMRGINGFGVLKQLKTPHPWVIFVTAYEQHAVDAFSVDAVDYLLKPFDRERFRLAIDKVRNRLADPPGNRLADQITTAVRDTVISVTGRGSSGAGRRIVAERDGRLYFLAQGDIDLIEADRNYVRVHCGSEVFRIRWTMQDAEATLDGSQFLRVHRSAIVNVNKIKVMERWFHGEYVISLASGQRLTSGRAYRQRIQGYLRNGR